MRKDWSELEVSGSSTIRVESSAVPMPDLRVTTCMRGSRGYDYAVDNIEITGIGTKPGEKLYEELMSDEEMRRSVELARYFAVLPAFRGIYQESAYDYEDVIAERVSNPYVSSREANLSLDEIVEFLKNNHLLDKPAEGDASRYWPGDKEEQKKDEKLS